MYQNLKLQIWKSGIRQNRLARELKMDETVLSKIINGYRQPSTQLKARIAQYLRIDEAWLFQVDGEDAPAQAPRRKRARGAAQ
ncbi:MAG TPA: helix-turn-helix transcriptional regulator [Terriglobales bacterium]|nr:helix-turn-helix transcriptional regulator [Terriglobales bacterium]